MNIKIKATKYPCTRATKTSAGYDLRCLHPFALDKNEIVSISTGVYLDIPKDVVAMVCPRSGLAVKHGVTVLNAPGIIDSDYKDEVKVILTKVTPYEVMFKEGERIAQLVFTKWLASDDVVETERDGGLGSTGTK